MDEGEDEVVAPGDAGEGGERRVVGAVEVGDDEEQPVVGDDPRRPGEGFVEPGGRVGDARRLRGEGEVAVGDEVEEPQHGAALPPGGDGVEARVGEDEAADAVALAEDAPGGQRGGLGGGDRLHVEDGAEEHRQALVDEEERRAVALLAGDADVGAPVRAVTFQSMARTSSPGR